MKRAILFLRIKSGVLQLTLGISLVIGIICMSMLMLLQFHSTIRINTDREQKLTDNVESAIQYVMANREDLRWKQKQMDLFGERIDSVDVALKPWGIFEIIYAKAFEKGHSYSKLCMLASTPDSLGLAALYSVDNNSPLYFTGKSSIVGDVFVSNKKFTTGYIDGRDFEKDKFMSGNIFKSQPRLPFIDTTLLQEVRNIASGKPTIYQLRDLDRFPTNIGFSYQLLTTGHYFSQQSIDITDSISGNVIIESSFKIRITATANLTDVIVIAPDIDIDNGFKGSLQCFASRSIIVGSDVNLKYPSALVLNGGRRDSIVAIGAGSLIEGAVIIAGRSNSITSNAHFKIDKGAVLHGMAYINGSSDIRGSIWGHITTRQFQVRNESTSYSNHLMDATIDVTKRSKFMPATLLWAHTNDLVIAKWLY